MTVSRRKIKRDKEKENPSRPKNRAAKLESDMKRAEKTLRVCYSGISTDASSSEASPLGRLLYWKLERFFPTPRVINRRRMNNRLATASGLFFRTFQDQRIIFEAIWVSLRWR